MNSAVLLLGSIVFFLRVGCLFTDTFVGVAFFWLGIVQRSLRVRLCSGNPYPDVLMSV